jgi:hypothetical protein
LGFLELRSERFLGKHLRVDVDIGETSPVFVRESPFGDEEACTTSESSIAGANLTAEANTDHEREAELEVVSTRSTKSSRRSSTSLCSLGTLQTVELLQRSFRDDEHRTKVVTIDGVNLWRAGVWRWRFCPRLTGTVGLSSQRRTSSSSAGLQA